MTDRKTLGFGVPNDIDPHHFVVEVPSDKTNPVVITEHFGLAGGDGADSVERCRLPQPAWNAIKKETERVLNERLKEKKLSGSRWKAGNNQVERLLGRELCVLAWAVETASKDVIPSAITSWGAFKPEERWWLFSMAASSTGTSNDVDIGWRKAIRIALTETPSASDLRADRPRKARRDAERPLLPLFEGLK